MISWIITLKNRRRLGLEYATNGVLTGTALLVIIV